MAVDFTPQDAPGGHKTSLDGDEAIYMTGDPTGTPVDVYTTPDDLLTYISGSISTSSPAVGTMSNGVISVTVASNNLTVAIKTEAGSDPSAGDPVIVNINGVQHTLTAALSVTANAATNWFNAGSSELATYEIDYFVYLGYNATDGVVIGFARIPFGGTYSSFSTTSTNESYCRISTITTAAASDPYTVIGRFAATLSAGAGYTWTVPTFTSNNLKQFPIHETRELDWLPTYSASGSLTYGTVTTTAKYRIQWNTLYFSINANGTTGGTTNTDIYATPPYTLSRTAGVGIGCVVRDSGFKVGHFYPNSTTLLTFRLFDGGNWGIGTNRGFVLSTFYPI